MNPVAGYRWGIYRGGSDGLYPAYEAAHGRRKKLLGKEALRPHVRWYTGFIPAREVAGKVPADIAAEQQGNPRVMDWMATFDLWPHGEAAKRQAMTAAQQAAFRTWVNHVARGIRHSRLAVIVEPDLPVVQKAGGRGCVWRRSDRGPHLRGAAEHRRVPRRRVQ